ncbi:hypothetical protein KY289_003448 [Solanum tuberosum]|nr:hypothetical protein KY284_003360 [Solanum tuberosum]KAH0732260.1 hypothetical protein KY289_003448 [Solanum tuberosum]
MKCLRLQVLKGFEKVWLFGSLTKRALGQYLGLKSSLITFECQAIIWSTSVTIAKFGWKTWNDHDFTCKTLNYKANCYCDVEKALLKIAKRAVFVKRFHPITSELRIPADFFGIYQKNYLIKPR